jgi:hypothetical protein
MVESLHTAHSKELIVNGEYFLFNLKAKIAEASVGAMTTERYGGAVLNDVPVNGTPCRVVVLGYVHSETNLMLHMFGKDIGKETSSTLPNDSKSERMLNFGEFGVYGTFRSASYTELDMDVIWDTVSTKTELLDTVLAVLEAFKEF